MVILIEPSRCYTGATTSSGNDSTSSPSKSRSRLQQQTPTPLPPATIILNRCCSIGERIQLHLGPTGYDYHIIFDHDDGITKWQNILSSSSSNSSSSLLSNTNISSTSTICSRSTNSNTTTTIPTTTTTNWIPKELVRQFRTLYQQQRYITHLSIGPIRTSEENGTSLTNFFIRASTSATTNDYYWSNDATIGSRSCNTITTASDTIPSIVAFGSTTTTTVIVHEAGNTVMTGPIITPLYERIARLQNDEKKKKGSTRIYRLRLYHHIPDAFFIHDTFGYQTNGIANYDPELYQVLKNNTNNVIDVIMALDGSWIVLLKNNFIASTAICPTLRNNLQDFYTFQNNYNNELQQRQQQQQRDGKNFIPQSLLLINQQQTQQQTQHLTKGSRVTVVGLSKQYGDAILYQIIPAIWVQIQSSSSNLWKVDDVASIIPYYDDPNGSSCTNNNGHYDDWNDYEEEEEDDELYDKEYYHPTDTTTIQRQPQPIAIVVNDGGGGIVTQSPPPIPPKRFIVRSNNNNNNYDNARPTPTPPPLVAAVAATDDDGTGATKNTIYYRKDVDQQAIDADEDDTAECATSNRDPVPPPLPLAQNYKLRSVTTITSRTVPTPTSSGPNVCIEKIDEYRLYELYENLVSDRNERNNLLSKLQQQGDDDRIKYANPIRILRKCNEIEAVVVNLAIFLRQYLMEKNGCVSYPVRYEPKKPTYPGRLIASEGQQNKLEKSVPRNRILPGMYDDELNAPLMGAFAYDIHCVHLDVHVLCSLAIQCNKPHLAKTLSQYRDNQLHYLQLITNAHIIDRGSINNDAMRLPTILINGGGYKTWLRAMKVPEADITTQPGKEFQAFLFGLQSEIQALANYLLATERFSWTEHVREQLEQQRNGKKKGLGIINRFLLRRIIQVCGNEVISLFAESVQQSGWYVRTKRSDGLIIEPLLASLSFDDCLQQAEQYCLAKGGWDIKLIEKPLHGLQDEPIPSLIEARKILYEFNNNTNLDDNDQASTTVTVPKYEDGDTE